MNSSNSLRPLGHTNLMVTPVGLGCWQFSKQKNLAGLFWPALDTELVDKIVAQSIDGGINWFDTAELYGKGESEKELARALKASGKKPGDVIVATKWWPAFRTASNINKTIGDRIKALEPFPVDLHQVHQPFGLSGEKKEMKAMAEIHKAGLIRNIGVSNFSARKMTKAWETLDRIGIPLASNQVPYSLLNRKIETNGIMDAAKKLGVSIIAYSPLAQGLLTGKFHDNPGLLRDAGMRKYFPAFRPSGLERSRPLINLLKELAEKYNASPSQVALNWLINFHGNTVVAIPGATKESHVRENTASMTFRLSEEDMDRVDRASSRYKHSLGLTWY